MGEVDVDVIGLETPQRIVDGRRDVRRRQPRARAELADFRREHDPMALAALLEPLADDRLRFAALMPVDPGGIDVRGIDEIQAVIDERIEDRERRALVGGPAEHVAAEDERRDFQFRCADAACLHVCSECAKENGPKSIRVKAAPCWASVRRLTTAFITQIVCAGLKFFFGGPITTSRRPAITERRTARQHSVPKPKPDKVSQESKNDRYQ